MLDLIIKNGLALDGTGNSGCYGDAGWIGSTTCEGKSGLW